MLGTKDYNEWRLMIRNDLKAIANKVEAGVETAAKDSFEYVQDESRVRTGSFKSNWNFSVDEPNLSFSDRRSLKKKSVNLRLAAAKIGEFRERSHRRKPLYMTNASPYADFLEREDHYLDKAEDKFFARFDRMFK